MCIFCQIPKVLIMLIIKTLDYPDRLILARHPFNKCQIFLKLIRENIIELFKFDRTYCKVCHDSEDWNISGSECSYKICSIINNLRQEYRGLEMGILAKNYNYLGRPVKISKDQYGIVNGSVIAFSFRVDNKKEIKERYNLNLVENRFYNFQVSISARSRDSYISLEKLKQLNPELPNFKSEHSDLLKLNLEKMNESKVLRFRKYFEISPFSTCNYYLAGYCKNKEVCNFNHPTHYFNPNTGKIFQGTPNRYKETWNLSFGDLKYVLDPDGDIKQVEQVCYYYLSRKCHFGKRCRNCHPKYFSFQDNLYEIEFIRYFKISQVKFFNP